MAERISILVFLFMKILFMSSFTHTHTHTETKQISEATQIFFLCKRWLLIKNWARNLNPNNFFFFLMFLFWDFFFPWRGKKMLLCVYTSFSFCPYALNLCICLSKYCLFLEQFNFSLYLEFFSSWTFQIELNEIALLKGHFLQAFKLRTKSLITIRWG